MNDEFYIPVSFEGRDYNFPARLLNYGYAIKLEVDIEGTTILFEHDEERNWRALILLFASVLACFIAVSEVFRCCVVSTALFNIFL
jgi:hypothetical protein